MEKLNIGVIGLGAIGQKHCSAIAVLERAKLCAVADINDKVMSSTAAQFGATPYTDVKEMLKHPGLDAVVIATPDDLHRDACVLAAQAGKHILVEKPIATTVEDAQAIIDAAETAGVKLMVGFTLRFSLHYMQARKAASDGTLGDMVSIYTRRENVISQPDRLKGRCGVLMFLGPHDFDAMRWIIGSEPVSVYTQAATSVPSAYPIENETFSIIRFANGVVGCAQIGWFLQDKHPAGRDFKLDIIGNKGSLNLDQMRQGIEIYTQNGAKFPSVSAGLVDEDRAFVDCILDNKTVPVTGQDGLAATRMVLAAMKSIETGQPVNL
ncbi:myo-inositol 2-dehydrogenase / D-chiro-inositol 1-dehydrogenase [Anaerolineales bacterium]|nr:myo-inositol 2-dehydrogenase / D-chiro-inositol 1-dehydrogenase [Anaerolineales bacterium]